MAKRNKHDTMWQWAWGAVLVVEFQFPDAEVSSWRCWPQTLLRLVEI